MNELNRKQNLNEFKFTKEQMEILRNIKDVDDLIIMFKRIIYISNCSYIDLLCDIQNKFDVMIGEMLK